MATTARERVIIAPQVMHFQSPTPPTGPSSIMKAEPPVPSPVMPQNDLTGLCVGPNGQKPFSSFEAPTAVNKMHGRSGSHLGGGPRDIRFEQESGETCAPVVSLGTKLNAALLVNMRSYLVGQAPLLFAFSPLSHLSASCSMAKRVLSSLRLNAMNSPVPVLFFLKDGAVL